MIVVRSHGWVANYSGGPYIDVGRSADSAVDCINVWDYVTDTPTIPYTRNAVFVALRRWVRESAEDYEREGY